jgi:hypothetical protein
MRTAKYMINLCRNHDHLLQTGNNKQIPALRCGARSISCTLTVGQEIHVQYSVLTLTCPSSFCQRVCVPLSNPPEHYPLLLHVFPCWLPARDKQQDTMQEGWLHLSICVPQESTIMLTSIDINQPEPPKSNIRRMTTRYISLVKGPSAVI